MAKEKKISVEKIQAVRKHLKSLPVKDNSKTIKECIDLLDKDLKEAFTKGYSYEDICEYLNSSGVDIKVSTLKSYLRKTDDEKKISSFVNTDTPDNDL